MGVYVLDHFFSHSRSWSCYSITATEGSHGLSSGGHSRGRNSYPKTPAADAAFDAVRLVITAAHCLPELPPSVSFSDISERTFKLFGPLGGAPEVFGECLFVDPIADLAILGPSDGQEMADQFGAYIELVEGAEPIGIADIAREAHASMLSLRNEWSPCTVRHAGGPLWIADALGGIAPGMSGSPIVDANGAAVGVVCVGSVIGEGDHDTATEGGPNPRLVGNLPGWLLRLVYPITVGDRGASDTSSVASHELETAMENIRSAFANLPDGMLQDDMLKSTASERGIRPNLLQAAIAKLGLISYGTPALFWRLPSEN